MTFGTIKAMGRQPYAPAVFTPRSFVVLIFGGRVDPTAHGSATPLGIDPETLRLAAQRLNHYAAPGPSIVCTKV
jgi:hypothetical protein